MTLRIFLGLLMAGATGYQAWIFWKWHLERRFAHHIMSDVTELAAVIEDEGLYHLVDEGGMYRLERGKWSGALQKIKAGYSRSGLRLALQAGGIAILITGLSFLLGFIPLFLNICAVLAPGLIPISEQQKAGVRKYVKELWVVVYAWNREDPDACLSYCLEDSSGLRQVHSHMCETLTVRKRLR